MGPASTGVLGGSALFWAWVIVLGSVVVAWGVVAAAIGPGPESRARRGAIALGSATLVAAFSVAVARFIAALRGVPDPLTWIRSLQRPGAPALTAYDVLVLLADVHAVLFPVWALLAALVHRRFRRAPPFRIPFRIGLALVLASSALSAPFLLKSIVQIPAGPALIDLLALLPMACAALAIWTMATRALPPVEVAKEEQTPAAVPGGFDVPSAWRRIGAIGREDTPLIATAARNEPAAAGRPTSTAWRSAGGTGPPPTAFDELSALWDQPGQAYLIGDIPEATERALTVASTVLAILDNGLRCIVVTSGDGSATADSANGYRDAVVSAFRNLAAWRVGELVAGTVELKDALAQHRLPSAAFFDVNDLSEGGIAGMCGPRNTAGPVWASGIGLVLVSKIDRGAPLQVTHRMFTLRRLSLALRAAGASWVVQATGFAGNRSALVERAFPGYSARDVPIGARATALGRAWLALEEFRSLPGDPWVKRALAPVADQGLEVAVDDPLGAFDRSVETWGKRVRLVRDLTFAGRASASALNEAWLIASYRMMGSLPPRGDGQPHDALWKVSPTPVAHFLLKKPQGRPGVAVAPGSENLSQFFKRGVLPSPRPLVGYDNDLVARAHLRAAIREGHGLQDLKSLSSLFGPSLVDQVLGDVKPLRWIVRRLPSGPDLVRTPLAGATAMEAANPVRSTVTDRVVRIIDENGGAELHAIDELLVPTRFYPGRVFAHGDIRFKVPFHALDEKRHVLRVTRAQGEALTAPLLDIAIGSSRPIEARLQRSFGGLRYETVGLEVTAIERVTGWRQVGVSGEPRIEKYDEVVTQYRTKARAIFFQGQARSKLLNHLAKSLDSVLVAFLLAGDEDVEVIPVPTGVVADGGSGVAAVDRHIGGMGIIQALDGETIDQALHWVRAILQGCPCKDGCPRCTPLSTLAEGPDKVGVVRLLGA